MLDPGARRPQRGRYRQPRAGVPALSGDWQRQDPEMRRYGHHLEKWTISEETGSNGGVREVGQRSEHPVDKPLLARH